MNFSIDEVVDKNFFLVKGIKSIKTHEIEEKMSVIEEIIHRLKEFHKSKNEITYYQKELSFLSLLYHVSISKEQEVDNVFHEILKKVSIYAYGLEDPIQARIYYEAIYAYYASDLDSLNRILLKTKKIITQKVNQKINLRMVLLKNIDPSWYIDESGINELKKHLEEIKE